MRVMIFLTALSTAGALAVTDTTVADEKKDEKKEPFQHPAKLEDFESKVSVRQKKTDGFIDARETVAHWGELKGSLVVAVYTTDTTIKVTKGSEITDKKTGQVWVATGATKAGENFTYYLCHVEKKPAEKKP